MRSMGSAHQALFMLKVQTPHSLKPALSAAGYYLLVQRLEFDSIKTVSAQRFKVGLWVLFLCVSEVVHFQELRCETLEACSTLAVCSSRVSFSLFAAVFSTDQLA